MQASIVFSLRVQCRRKESSRSLSHLLMSFLYNFVTQQSNIPSEGNEFLLWILTNFKTTDKEYFRSVMESIVYWRGCRAVPCANTVDWWRSLLLAGASVAPRSASDRWSMMSDEWSVVSDGQWWSLMVTDGQCSPPARNTHTHTHTRAHTLNWTDYSVWQWSGRERDRESKKYLKYPVLDPYRLTCVQSHCCRAWQKFLSPS